MRRGRRTWGRGSRRELALDGDNLFDLAGDVGDHVDGDMSVDEVKQTRAMAGSGDQRCRVKSVRRGRHGGRSGKGAGRLEIVFVVYFPGEAPVEGRREEEVEARKRGGDQRERATASL